VTHRQRKAAFAGVLLALLLAALDQTVVSTALPRIAADLHGFKDLSWIVTAYLLTSTATVPLYGKFSDLYGRRTMFVVALGLFTLSSLACGLAPTALFLVIARLVQGLAGGLLTPQISALIQQLFSGRERGTAFGVFGATVGVSTAIGPLLGGALIQAFGTDTGWRWVFLVNLPIGIIGTGAAFLFLKEISARNRGESFDGLGAIFFSGALVSLLFALNQGIGLGWTSPTILGLFVVWIVLSVVFYVWSRHREHPILDFSLFANRVFTAAVSTATLQSLAVFAVNLLVVYYLEVVQN